MNNRILIIIFWMLAFSCKAPVSSFQNNEITLLSAEKSEWFGGRPGVRGTVYTVVLKPKDKRDRIKISSFTAEGNTVSFTRTDSGNVVRVKGNVQLTDRSDAPDYSPSGSSVNMPEQSGNPDPGESWIGYTLNDSKNKYRILIPKFTSIEPVGELIPRRP